MPIPKMAPDTFAKTSNKSACLVAVNNSCEISIPIPKTTENRTANSPDLQKFTEFVCLSRNKKQRIVKTKWKKRCTTLSRFETFPKGTVSI